MIEVCMIMLAFLGFGAGVCCSGPNEKHELWGLFWVFGLAIQGLPWVIGFSGGHNLRGEEFASYASGDTGTWFIIACCICGFLAFMTAIGPWVKIEAPK